MVEIVGNAWDWYGRGHIVAIPTNGIVNKNRECVMGRGIALQAAQRFPDLPRRLGNVILATASKVTYFPEYGLIAFPTKHHWKHPSDLALIEQSARDLAAMTEWLLSENPYDPFRRYDVTTCIILPRPGCGNGGLLWEDVRPVIEPILPDSVWVISQ